MASIEADIDDPSLDRKLRLKSLIERGVALEKKIQNDKTQDVFDEIKNIVSTSDEILSEGNVEDRVQHSTEMVMDAQVLKMSHELVSKVMQTNSDYNAEMYQRAINRVVYSGGETPDWSQIAKMAICCATPTRMHSTMLGTIDVEVTETQKARRQTHKKNLTQESQPESVDKLERKDKGAKKVNIVYKKIADILKETDQQPIPFYKLIIDPSDFMRTVENAFQVSFLVRDNRIAIDLNEQGYPMVRLATKAELKTEKEPTQSICSLDYGLCSKMIEFYNITEAMLSVPDDD